MLLFLQSIIVYGFMAWAMCYFGNIAYKKQYPQGFGGIDIYKEKKLSFGGMLTKSYFLIPIFVFCFFSAVRYKVGVDCESYKMRYQEIISYFGFIYRDIEPGFIFLGKLAGNFDSTHYLFFFILALLQIGPLYYAQRKTTYTLKYFGIALIMSGMFFSLMNGIRQNIATCVFVAIIPCLLEKKKIVWYILGVFLASLMHKSAFLLYPLGLIAYFLQYKIPSKYIQLALVAVCFVLMDKIDISIITDTFFSYGAEAGYDDKTIENYANYEEMNKAFGFRSLLLLATYIITIWYSENMKKMFTSKVFNIQYNLFFIGVCTFLLFYNDFTINRLLYYLKIFTPIILASCMFYLSTFKAWKERLSLKLIIILLLTNTIYELFRAMQNYPLEYNLYKFDLFRDDILKLY